jgi:hypothetical protein
MKIKKIVLADLLRLAINLLIRLFKKTICVLLFITTIWFLIVQFNKLNKYSKLNYFVENDQKFMISFDNYMNTSLKSLNETRKWLKSNYKLAGLKNVDQTLFSNTNLIRETRHDKKEKSLCISVLSKERNGQRSYVIQTVISLLTRTKLKYQDRILINIFNVASDPSSHRDLDALGNLLNIINLNDLKDIKLVKLIEGFESQLKIKEALDFSVIMNYIYINQTLCDYALIIEDDAIAAYNWYEKLIDSLRLIDKNTNWFCLKLFTSYRYYDWLAHLNTVVNSILLIFLLTFISVFIYSKLMINVVMRSYLGSFLVSKLSITTSSITNKSTVVIFFLNSCLLIFAYNAFNISPLGYGIIKYSQGFNAVANLYPRSKLNQIAKHVEYTVRSYVQGHVTNFEPKDIALKTYKKTFYLDEYIIEPSLFQHIGLHSSLGGSGKLNDVHLQQYRPFQSYSFNKEYFNLINFDPNYWLS